MTETEGQARTGREGPARPVQLLGSVQQQAEVAVAEADPQHSPDTTERDHI